MIVFGCEDTTAPVVQQLNPIIGSWVWVSTKVFFGGMIITPETEGFTMTDQYGLDSNNSVFRNDTLSSERRYLVIENPLRDTSGNTVDVLLVGFNHSLRSANTQRRCLNHNSGGKWPLLIIELPNM